MCAGGSNASSEHGGRCSSRLRKHDSYVVSDVDTGSDPDRTVSTHGQVLRRYKIGEGALGNIPTVQIAGNIPVAQPCGSIPQQVSSDRVASEAVVVS